MKILFEIVSALLYFNFVSPVLMYYIYDDSPNIGFVAVENSVGTYMKSGFSAGKAAKRQFTGAYSNPKFPKINSENVVDSHFKVRKTPSKLTIPAAVDTGRLRTQEEGKNKVQRTVEEYRNTEAPKQWQQKPQHQQMITTGQQDKQITKSPNMTPVRGDYGAKSKEAALHNQPSNNQQIPPIRPKPVNADYTNSMKKRNQDAGSSQTIQEPGRSQRTQDVVRSQIQKDVGRSQTQDGKPTYVNVQMNVRKAPVSADPQKKVLLNNNRQVSSMTVLTAQDKRQRMPVSMIMDKTLHKANGIAHDHNMQVMSRVLDDMTSKIADRRHKKGEYVNRDTENQLDAIYEKSKRSVLTDYNMRKYIGKEKIGKDLRNQNKQNTARIGSREESLELDDTPYAVFYRMNPETLDRQEEFMMGDNGSSEIASKENRAHTAFEEDTENMTNKHKSIKNGNTLQRKKLKNFSNYRN